MSIKLIATDMDGTLLNSKKELPKDFFSWVDNNPDKKVVIASGRQLYALLRDLSYIENKAMFICENGAIVYNQGNFLYTDKLADEHVRRCFEIFDNTDMVRPVICGVNSAYMVNPTEDDLINAGMYYARLKGISTIEEAIENDTIVKLALFVFEEKAAEKMPLFDCINKEIDVVLSGTSWIDFANFSATKGNALLEIMKQMSLDKSEVMAFGDYLNDYSLLMACEESYCMANGHPEVKAIAKHIAKSNDEDGVMEVLRSL